MTASKIIEKMFGGDPEYQEMLAEERALTTQEITQRKTDFEKSSGNLFADLGLEDAEEMHEKANRAQVIREQIRARNLTNIEAANLVGADESTVSDIQNGRIREMSKDTLFSIAKQLVLA